MLIRRLTPKDTDCFQALRLQALREDASAFAGEELVGMIGVGRETLRKTRHKGFIRAMYVAPGRRGAGIAKRLITEAVAVLESMGGVRQVTLAVTSDNAAATALYASLGFTPFGREPDSLLVDGVMYEDTHMVRFLADGA